MIIIFQIAGIFSGIGLFLSMMYSLTQILLMRGWVRIAHGVLFVLILTVMSTLFFWRDVVTAQVLAVPLLCAAIWVTIVETRWYRVFPIIVIVFSISLASGAIYLNPI